MSTNYVVEVQTSNFKNAGTDANVFIQLVGELGASSEYKLDNASDNFERGKFDTFSITSEDVGWINYIRVFHDNNGNSPGWFLNYVKISDPLAGLSWKSNFNRWLAVDENDGRIDVTKEVPVGNVSIIKKGNIQKYFLGYISKRYNNQQSTLDFHVKDTFTYKFKRGCSVDLSSTVSIKTNLELSKIIFGSPDSKFGFELATVIAEKLGTTAEEATEWITEVDCTVPGGKSITMIVMYSQMELRGTATTDEISLNFQQKFNISPELFFFDGILTDRQVDERVTQLLNELLGIRLSRSSIKEKIPILMQQKRLNRMDATNINTAVDKSRTPLITELLLKKHKDIHSLKSISKQS